MDDLTLLGAVDVATLKKNAPYIGAGLGALLGLMFSKMLFGHRGTKHMLGMNVSRRFLSGATGATAGAVVGHFIKK
jgi:hypothetical protein